MEKSKLDIEQAKLEIEKWRLEEEMKLKKWQIEEDIKFKQYELENKKDELFKAKLSSPILLAIVGLFTTLLVNSTQNYLQSKASRDIERQRFESSLIQKAIELPSREESAKQFTFLLDVGLISDETGKLRNYVKHPQTIPNAYNQKKTAWMNKAGKINNMIVHRKYSEIRNMMVDDLKPIITEEIFNTVLDSVSIILGDFQHPIDTTYNNDNVFIKNQYQKGTSVNTIIFDSQGRIYGVFVDRNPN